MINDLLVKPELLKVFLMPPYTNPQSANILARLNRNNLLINKHIRTLWMAYFEQNGLKDQFQFWLSDVIKDTGSIFKVIPNIQDQSFEAIEEEMKLFEYGLLNPDALIIGDFNESLLKQYPICKVIPQKHFGNTKKNEISMEDLKLIEKKGGIMQEWFSIFETKIDLQIEQNKSATLLAEYLSKFIVGEEVTIQDVYLPTNLEHEKNFKNYIYPIIKNMKSKTLIIAKEDGAAHKKRLEQKYKLNVVCYDKNTLHQSFIKTENYTITLGYRFNVFGTNGKTKREKISIIRND